MTPDGISGNEFPPEKLQDPGWDAAWAHFSQFPWCKKMLDDPHNRFFTPYDRIVKPDGEGLFLGKTLNTPDTFEHVIAFYRTVDENGIPLKEGEIPREVFVLCKFGDGLGGHPHQAQGTAMTAVLVEFTGCLCYWREERISYTRLVTSEYLKQLDTPAVLLIKGKLLEQEGRKFWVETRLVDAEDNVYAKCKYLSIQARDPKI